MKVAELTGNALDYWTGKADEKDVKIFGHCWLMRESISTEPYSPSTSWSQGGPIIEREHIMLEPGGPEDSWCAHIWLSEAIQWLCIEGSTPLIAAMRCYVASKFGEEVPDDPTK